MCDLPYGVLTQQKGATPFGRNVKGPSNSGCAWDVKIDLSLFWEQVKRLARDDHTPVLMFCSAKFGYELIASNPSWFRYDIVWAKTNGVGFLLANKQPLRSHELIYVFSKKGAYYKRIDIEGDFPRSVGPNHKRSGQQKVYGSEYADVSNDNTGKRCVKSVIELSNKKGKGNHPTQKPDELYTWLLERYCVAGGTMLDPTAGSFSSVFTARDMGLHAIGIEKDDTFFWKAVAKI